MNWTDERVEKMKRLWAEGLSASQIAAQLGGVSRNAVIGKVHRLSLPGRSKGVSARSRNPTAKAPKPARPKNPGWGTGFKANGGRKPADERLLEAMRPQEEQAAWEVEPDRSSRIMSVVPVARRLDLTELTENTCHWPIGDPVNGRDDFHFCGCEASDGSPYCSYHAKLAYQPVSRRRKPAGMQAGELALLT